MDAVLGRASNAQCVLTLYHVPIRFQFDLLPAEKTEEEALITMRNVSSLLGSKMLSGMFAVVLTHNESELGDEARLARLRREEGGAPEAVLLH